MRRSLASAALALLFFLAAVPMASAHDEAGTHHVTWGADAPEDGDTLFGSDFVTARAEIDDGVKKWRIEMKPESGGAPFFCETDVPNNPLVTDLKFRCDWNTARSGSVVNQKPAEAGFAVNGRYVITVTVWNHGRNRGLLTPAIEGDVAHVLQPTRTVIVQNPVSQPTGIVRTFDSGSRTATIGWHANPEPDIEKYVIQETTDGGKTWAKVGERPGGSTSFQRPVERPGTYRYRVSAVRPGVEQSPWTVTDPLEVAATPEPTPTTSDAGQPPAGGDGGVPFVPGAAQPSPPSPVTPGTAAPAAPRPSFGGGTGIGSFTLPSSRPSVPAGRPQVTTTTEFDPGYSQTLPYKPKAGGDASPEGEEQELAGGEEETPQSMTRIITIPRPRDTRALLVPLAAGLTLFVFAMQITYFIRQRPALATVEDDFDDWMGNY